MACCRFPEARAEVTLPSAGPARWPVPVGGLRSLWREIGRADVVLANCHLFVLPQLAAVIARLRRIPGFYAVHGAMDYPAAGAAQRIAAAVNDHLFLPVSLRALPPLTVSRAGARYIQQRWSLASARMPFPARNATAARPAAELTDQPARIVWAARLAPEKAPLIAVDAVDRIVAAGRRVRFEIYGDGPLMHLLQAAATDRPWMRLHGDRPWEDVIAAQNAAHLCLSSSIGDNVQLALLEPLARGVPCVSTRVGDAPDYYPPALRWACVEPDDALALAAASEKLLSEHARWSAEFRAAGELLRERHSDAAAADALERLLVDAASGRARR